MGVEPQSAASSQLNNCIYRTIVYQDFGMSETKPSSELLSAIVSADTKALKDVATVENPAAKHDMAMFGVAKFDKNKLKTVETVEKNSLPTADDLKDAKDQEKTH